jgi:6-phosphogluconolactonase
MPPTELGVPWWIYVGSTGAGGKGIHLFQMKTSENPDIPEFVTMTSLGLVAQTPRPAFIAIDPRRALLFAVNEIDRFEGKPSGSVSAFAVQRETGKLTLLGQWASMGVRPGHLALARDGKHLLVANDGGSVAVLPVTAEGKLGTATDVRQHGGKGRPRGVSFSPDNRFAFACDLGLDQVIGYRFDAAAGKLSPNPSSVVRVKPGAGPRHLLFRPDGKFAYVVNELDSTVTVFAHDAGAGTLKPLQTLSTLPGYYDGPNRACEIGVHPSGKYLLVANGGHNSVVLFDIAAATGLLTYVEDQSTYGTMPVHFGMDADGKHFAVANRDSGSLLILRAPESGRVKPGGNSVKVPSPACAVFLAAPAK